MNLDALKIIGKKAKEFDIEIHPIKDVLYCEYNGIKLKIKVDGVEVHSCVSTVECSFCLDTEQNEPAEQSWGILVQGMLSKVLYELTVTAINEQTCMKQEGRYYVN